ncbi:rhamnan synthesis F family protein, partial [Stenotrophomonas maltophilia group sp. RNC7]
YEVSSYITDQNLQGGKLNSIGAVTARTLPDDINPSLNIPFEQSEGDIIFDRVAVVAHIFYPELTEEIIGYIKNIPVPFGLFITTDTEEKKNRIRDAIDGTDVGAIEVVIRVTPNRGRDIAPKYIA